MPSPPEAGLMIALLLPTMVNGELAAMVVEPATNAPVMTTKDLPLLLAEAMPGWARQ